MKYTKILAHETSCKTQTVSRLTDCLNLDVYIAKYSIRVAIMSIYPNYSQKLVPSWLDTMNTKFRSKVVAFTQVILMPKGYIKLFGRDDNQLKILQSCSVLSENPSNYGAKFF